MIVRVREGERWSKRLQVNEKSGQTYIPKSVCFRQLMMMMMRRIGDREAPMRVQTLLKKSLEGLNISPMICFFLSFHSRDKKDGRCF